MIKGILFLALFILIPAKSEAFYFSFGFGNGKEEIKQPCDACAKSVPVDNKAPCLTAQKTEKAAPSKPKSKPKPQVSAAQQTKSDPPKKPEYLVKAEKMVKVKKPHKRDWTTLTADSIGAGAITYGARKSNWFIGSGGAVILLYSLIAERNTNSFLDQTVAIGTGVGLGYLPKINDDPDDSRSNQPVSLPPPPTP